MSMIVLASVSAGLAGPILETRYGPNLGDGPFGLPRLFGLTPLALTGISFWILAHGLLKVGKARKKYSDLAKKDGENRPTEWMTFQISLFLFASPICRLIFGSMNFGC